MSHPKKIFSFSVLDILFLLPPLAFAAWIYLIPPFQTFGYHTLFSDDAIFAMMARKVLSEGLQGAYHLSWGPLFPWLIAYLNNFFNIPLDEGGRVITGMSLTLRVIPVYFLAKLIFNRLAGFLAALLATIYIFILIPQEAALSEGLYTLIVSTGFLVSLLALKTEKIIYYILSGVIWGAAYLTRFEGWFFLTPLLLLTATEVLNTEKRRHSVKLIAALLLSFFIIILPYLSFVRQVYGAWSLNPRVNIALVAPGNNFTLIKDNYGISTPAQIYFSGEHKYYTSDLWHPTPLTFWRALGRSWPTFSITPGNYLNFFHSHTPVILYGGILGLILNIYLIFRRKISLTITLTAIFALMFSILDFSLTTLEFTSPVIFNPNGNIVLFFDQFYRMVSTEGYPGPLVRDLLIITTTSLWFIFKKRHFKLLLKLFQNEKLKLFLPLSLLLGLIPLLFNSFASKYTVVLGSIFFIYAVFFLLQVISFLKTLLIIRYSMHILFILTFVWFNFSFVYQALSTRENQYKSSDLQIQFLKEPGLAILKDNGPGAKIAVFHEAPVFYAKGIPFYFAADSNITLKQSLNYFEENNVEYIVLSSPQYYSWKQLRPLLLPTTNIPHWEMIYSNPPAGRDVKVTDTHSDVLVTVWKYID